MALLDYLPVTLVTGTGLVGWGDLRARVSGLRKDVDAKVSTDAFAGVETRLARIESQLDRLLERGLPHEE